MAALMTTMFVPTKSPPQSSQQTMNAFPSPPRPLESVVTLAESHSYSHLPLPSSPRGDIAAENFRSSVQQYPAAPRSVYASPVQKNFHAALRRPQYLQMADVQGTSNSRTRAPFRPQKAGKGTTNWQLKQFAEATLGNSSLRKAVKLPEGEDKDEWLAVNVVDFYNQINLLYGSITEFCSPQTCPEMKATDEFEYLWQDEEHYKKPTKMPAPEYVEHLMSWVQATIDNENIFPSRIGVAFPKQFRPRLAQIFKRLYRVYAHMYCHHYPVVVALGLEPHLNTSFKHYVLFIEEHGLAAGQRDYWGPMGELVEHMLKNMLRIDSATDPVSGGAFGASASVSTMRGIALE